MSSHPSTPASLITVHPAATVILARLRAIQPATDGPRPTVPRKLVFDLYGIPTMETQQRSYEEQRLALGSLLGKYYDRLLDVPSTSPTAYELQHQAAIEFLDGNAYSGLDHLCSLMNRGNDFTINLQRGLLRLKETESVNERFTQQRRLIAQFCFLYYPHIRTKALNRAHGELDSSCVGTTSSRYYDTKNPAFFAGLQMLVDFDMRELPELRTLSLTLLQDPEVWSENERRMVSHISGGYGNEERRRKRTSESHISGGYENEERKRKKTSGD